MPHHFCTLTVKLTELFESSVLATPDTQICARISTITQKIGGKYSKTLFKTIFISKQMVYNLSATIIQLPIYIYIYYNKFNFFQKHNQINQILKINLKVVGMEIPHPFKKYAVVLK